MIQLKIGFSLKKYNKIKHRFICVFLVRNIFKYSFGSCYSESRSTAWKNPVYCFLDLSLHSGWYDIFLLFRL